MKFYMSLTLFILLIIIRNTSVTKHDTNQKNIRGPHNMMCMHPVLYGPDIENTHFHDEEDLIYHVDYKTSNTRRKI